jgi:hypothetical protein
MVEAQGQGSEERDTQGRMMNTRGLWGIKVRRVACLVKESFSFTTSFETFPLYDVVRLLLVVN